MRVAGSKRSQGYRESWTLPTPPEVQASFSPEGIGRKIVKLFKKELQTGDADFDAAVYVGTDTRDATAAWLARPEVRALIGDAVSRGGWFRIEGARVEGEVVWPLEEAAPPGQDVIARVVVSLLGS